MIESEAQGGIDDAGDAERIAHHLQRPRDHVFPLLGPLEPLGANKKGIRLATSGSFFHPGGKFTRRIGAK